MKFIALIVAALAAGWYHFVGGARLDAGLVEEFYARQAHYVLSRDPEGLCSQYAAKLRVSQEAVMLGQTAHSSYDRNEACEANRKTFASFQEIGDQVNGILTLEYEYRIEGVEIAPNRKSALVRVASTLKVGESLMQLRNESEETLIRRWGKVQLLKADTQSRVRMHLPALMNPEQYLQ